MNHKDYRVKHSLISYFSLALYIMNSPPAAWGSPEARFTQPSLRLLFHVCKCGDEGKLETEFLAVKHESRILRHSSNHVCGFSMMEQVRRLCSVWPTKNWLGSSLKHIQGWTTVQESYSRALEQGSLVRNTREHFDLMRRPLAECCLGWNQNCFGVTLIACSISFQHCFVRQNGDWRTSSRTSPCTELAKKVCPRLRDLATAPAGGITQPRTNFFGQLCTCFVFRALSWVEKKSVTGR